MTTVNPTFKLPQELTRTLGPNPRADLTNATFLAPDELTAAVARAARAGMPDRIRCISTLQFAHDLLVQHGCHVGFRPDLQMVGQDPADQLKLVVALTGFEPAAASALVEQLRHPDPDDPAPNEAVSAYRQRCRQVSIIDPDLLCIETEDLLRQHPAVGQLTGRIFQTIYICDPARYQPMHWRIIGLLQQQGARITELSAPPTIDQPVTEGPGR